MIIVSKGGGLLAVLYCVLLSQSGAQAAEGTWSRRADISAAQGDWIPLAGALPHEQPQPFHQARLLQPQIPPQILNQQFHQPIVSGWNEEHEARQQAHYVEEDVNKGRVSSQYPDGVRTDQEQYQQRPPSPQHKEQVQILYVPVETLRQRSRGLISQKELVKQSNLKEEDVYLDAPQSRHQIPPAERHPTIPTGQREIEATKNTPQRLAQQIPTPNIPEVPQTVPQQQFSTPQIIPQQNLAPQNVAEHIPLGLPARPLPPSQSHVLLQVTPQYFQQPAVHQTPIATLIQQIPQQQQQTIPKPKEKEPFRHPIQPLKDQKPGNIKITKINPDYYDSIKETSQSVMARDQLFQQYQDEEINQPKLKYEELTTIRQESPRNKQLLRHQAEEAPVTRKEEITQVTKEEPSEEDKARNWYDNNYTRNNQEQIRQRYEQLTTNVGGVEYTAPQPSGPKYDEVRPQQTYQYYPEQQTTTVFTNEENRPRKEGVDKSRQSIPQSNAESVNLPPPNQPPLSVYMETGPNTKVGDVLSLLNGAKTIPVLDTIGPNSPQVFVGPSNLKAPQGYVKFELPYLSSLDGNRVERKVLQLPFFVAPLNFNPPAGYAKIPFPPPHIGSVVLSNVSANLEEKEPPPQVKLSPTTIIASTNSEPYTIPADISSISPHLPSLVNSLQEEQGTTPKSEVVPETELPRKPATRRPVYRGSQRGYSTTSSTSSPRRNYAHRRRPYNRNSSRQQTTETATLNTIDQQQISQNQQINNFSQLDQQEIQQNTYKNQNYKNLYDNNNNVGRPTTQIEEEGKEVSDVAQYHITAEQVPSSEQNKNTAVYQYDYVTTTEQLQTRNYQTKQTIPTGAAMPPGFEEAAPVVHSQELRKPYERPTLHIPTHLQQEVPQISPDTDRQIRPLYQTESLQPTTERIQKEIYNQQYSAYNEDVKPKYHLVEPTVENENQQRVSAQYPIQTSTAPRTAQQPDSAHFPPIYDLKNHKDQSDFYNVQDVPSNPTVQFPDYQTVTEDMKLSQVSEDNNSRLQNHRLQNEKVENDDTVEYKTESVLRETTRSPSKGRNRLRSRLYTSRLRTTTVPTSEDKLYDYTKRYSRDEITEPPRRTNNNLRSRRPSRPITTTTAPPVTITTTLPPGTKYLIRTRRPTNNGQIKLKTGRSRIRRPTTPTTTTTTTTTTVNPFANFNVQLNQQQQYYDSLQDTTPFPNRYVIPNGAPSSSQAGYDSQGPLPMVSTEDYYKQDDHKTSTKLPKDLNYYDVQNRQKDKNLNNNYWTQSFKQDDYEQAVVSSRPEEDLYEQAKRQKGNALKDEYWVNPVSVKQADYRTTTPKQELYYEQPNLRQKEKLNENNYWEENLKKEYEIPSRSRSSSTEYPSRRQKVKTAQREWPAVSDRPQSNSQYYENLRKQKVAAPKLTTEAPQPRAKFTESPLNSKDAQDFWNQAVTIQQSKSYEYNPDDEIRTVRKTTAATPHDDYYYDDQSPFPSNEQQVTYVGVKAGVERGKENQYAIDVQDEVLQSPAVNSEAPQLDNNKSPDMEHIYTTNQTNNSSVERKAGRRRGTWVKVRVKKTKDVFETAESQRFGSLVSNSLHEPIKEVSKILTSDKTKKIETDSIESNTNVDNIINESTTEQLPTTTSIEQIKDLEFETTTIGEGVETSTTGLAALLEESTTMTTILPETPLPKVLATSTTTEVTLETEICYRGRCVKTKGSRPTVQQDLLPSE